MDYQAIYDRLMDRALPRELYGYCERHHVVPRCMGGDDSADNIRRLTPEEHYVAHQLLMKMHPGNRKLAYAAFAMTFGSDRVKRNNKLYGWLRRAFAKSVSETQTGKTRGPHSVETRQKMSESAKGRKKSEAHRAALSAARTGVKRGPHTEEHKRSLSKAIKAAMPGVDRAYMQTPEYKAQQSQKMREIWAARKSLSN